MKNKHWKWAIILLSILFAILFHKNLVGVNFLLFDIVFISLALIKFKPKLGINPFTILLLANVLMAFIVVLNGSSVSKTMGWISLLILQGSFLFPTIKSILKVIGSYFANQFYGIISLISGSNGGTSKRRFTFFRSIKIILLPLVIIFVFSIFYKSSNPIFNDYFNSFFNKVGDFFGKINGEFVFLLFVGLFLSIILVLNQLNSWDKLKNSDELKHDELKRIRKRTFFSSFLALKTEHKSAVVLFVGLNLLILVFNITDVKHLWFNFNWDGGFLKAFVHEGTYLLIVSVVLSIIVTLIYFRRNLNFIHGNKLLKVLAIIWLSQNIFMLISVAIRNYHYIAHFALAYKRIGVYFFLAICAVGLITCIIKVWNRKSFYFLERTNALSVYLLLILMACINWDIVIAKYNFSHYNKSFLHLPYMLNLSDKALPYLDYTKEQLNEIDSTQSSKFSYEGRGYHKKVKYKNKIERRKTLFIKEFEKRHWLSWNYADYKAYTILKED